MVWFSFDEHIFDHSWEKVVAAAFRKYPNPQASNVTGTDIFERNVDQDGKLHSRRLITSIWSNAYIEWMSKFSGFDLTKTMHAFEYSVLDPQKKSFELTSRNYNFLDYITVDEKLIYTPHPTDPASTLLKQEYHVTCKNLSFNSFLENALGTTMQSNAKNGRKGMEYVIKQVKEEVEKFTSSVAVGEMQNFASNTLHEFSNSIGVLGKKWEENLQEEINEFLSQNQQTN